MKDKLINLIENNSIEISFKSRIPYLCNGTTSMVLTLCIRHRFNVLYTLLYLVRINN